MSPSELADTLDRRARQCSMIADDLADDAPEDTEHGPEYFEGKCAGYEAAVKELRDHAVTDGDGRE
ncbi:hypothetical protein [Halobacterium zhouii]|uniref:hypothetical protein n=1 Tax=Halobacterium zhouii TaxID=2902624 RepID=UPI001E621FE3|nr:hypothetical protein [Halobacterium zhouii]